VEDDVADKPNNNGGGTGQLGGELGKLKDAVMSKVGSQAEKHMGSLTERLTDLSSGGGGGDAKKAAGAKAGEKIAGGESPVKAALSAGATGIKEKVSGMFGGGKSGGKNGKKLKVTNIIEEIDIGAPIDVVYNQWTQFQDFSGFMKKVENVDQKEDTEVTFKAQVLWSHREWKAQIVDQVPNERIVWKSSGQKGKVDGAVTFHELAPDLTRVLVVLEYHPQGLFERTGNMWRAQGRRVRLELKHFRRHVMTDSLLHPDDIEGWRGEIHDGDVQVSDEDARRREQDSDSSDENDDSGDDNSRSEAQNRRRRKPPGDRQQRGDQRQQRQQRGQRPRRSSQQRRSGERRREGAR
jgi:uncharacterized membrane protein